MVTLIQAAVLTKRAIIILAGLVFLSLALPIGLNIYYRYSASKLPPPQEKPEMKFGNLPQLSFDQATPTAYNFNFSLDTVTGGLPQTPKLMKVYYLPHFGVSFLAPDRAIEVAQKLGFDQDPQIIESREYKFTDNFGGSLNVDLTTGNLHFKRDLSKLTNPATPSATSNQSLEDKEHLTAQFSKFLFSLGLLNDELKAGKTNIIYVGPDASQVQKWLLTIFPADIDKIPIITPNYQTGLVKALVSSQIYSEISKTNLDTSSITTFDFVFWPVDLTTFSTYPLKSADQAFTDLKNQKGFISTKPPKGNDISITSVSLAYLQTSQYSAYLQPVFVFEGPNFLGLVSAVSSFAPK